MEDNNMYIVMENCQHSLRYYKSINKKINDYEIRKILKDVCEGLSYLHKNRRSHLVLKPENILKSKNGNYKISDFILSGFTSLQEQEYPLMGDYRYTPKEMLGSPTSNRKVDYSKVDIFSLGITLYELLIDGALPKFG